MRTGQAYAGHGTLHPCYLLAFSKTSFNQMEKRHYEDLVALCNLGLTHLTVEILSLIHISGSIEATEVLKIICGFGEVLSGKLWTIDLRTLQSNKFSL